MELTRLPKKRQDLPPSEAIAICKELLSFARGAEQRIGPELVESYEIGLSRLQEQIAQEGHVSAEAWKNLKSQWNQIRGMWP